jgi:hypothetical protein
MWRNLPAVLIAVFATTVIVVLAAVVIDNDSAEAPVPEARFQEAGLITARNNGEPANRPFATLVRAGDPFLYVVFELTSDDAAYRFGVSIDWKFEGDVIEHDEVETVAGERAWALCESCHTIGAFEVELALPGTRERVTIPFRAE